MGLSKAYDYLPLDCFVAKVAAYEVDMPSLDMIYD